jgi:hypothetical protein
MYGSFTYVIVNHCNKLGNGHVRIVLLLAVRNKICKIELITSKLKLTKVHCIQFSKKVRLDLR